MRVLLKSAIFWNHDGGGIKCPVNPPEMKETLSLLATAFNPAVVKQSSVVNLQHDKMYCLVFNICGIPFEMLAEFAVEKSEMLQFCLFYRLNRGIVEVKNDSNR